MSITAKTVLWSGHTGDVPTPENFSPWFRVARIVIIACAVLVALIIYNKFHHNPRLSIDDILNNKTAAVAIGSSVALVSGWQLQGLLRDILGIRYRKKDDGNRVKRYITETLWTGQRWWRLARLATLVAVGIITLMIIGGRADNLNILEKSDLALYLFSFVGSATVGWQLNGLYIEEIDRSLYSMINPPKSVGGSTATDKYKEG